VVLYNNFMGKDEAKALDAVGLSSYVPLLMFPCVNDRYKKVTLLLRNAIYLSKIRVAQGL
jgi:hypothetical protein